VSAGKTVVTPATTESAPGAAPATLDPLRPRRGLFVGLMLLFLAWVAVLLVMYFTLVYPARHSHPGASGAAATTQP
jgi:hypothetical protein